MSQRSIIHLVRTYSNDLSDGLDLRQDIASLCLRDSLGAWPPLAEVEDDIES